ncbi:hypothetical protein ACLKA6_003666, partial [Drosophila palustris]
MEADEEKILALLKDFQMESIFDYLKAAKITFESLKSCDKEDLREAIPPLGLRIEFREKLFHWRKTVFGIDDETLSAPSKVADWIIHNCSSSVSEKSDSSNLKVLQREYYFIPRKGRANAGGKLMSRYRNQRSKKAKYESTAGSISCIEEESHNEEDLTDEVDSSIGIALKDSLNRDCSDWEEVKDKWCSTFHMRQSDLESMDPIEFLKNWTRLSDARASDLINIDFDKLYPTKKENLFLKWNHFKINITNYYEENLTNSHCKEQFSDAKKTKNKDAEDYLFAILLSGVLPSSARFKDNVGGKKRKKATLIEAQESFILRLININDYTNKVSSVINKSYAA